MRCGARADAHRALSRSPSAFHNPTTTGTFGNRQRRGDVDDDRVRRLHVACRFHHARPAPPPGRLTFLFPGQVEAEKKSGAGQVRRSARATAERSSPRPLSGSRDRTEGNVGKGETAEQRPGEHQQAEGRRDLRRRTRALSTRALLETGPEARLEQLVARIEEAGSGRA